jgi:hypothetical protein
MYTHLQSDPWCVNHRNVWYIVPPSPHNQPACLRWFPSRFPLVTTTKTIHSFAAALLNFFDSFCSSFWRRRRRVRLIIYIFQWLKLLNHAFCLLRKFVVHLRIQNKSRWRLANCNAIALHWMQWRNKQLIW